MQLSTSYLQWLLAVWGAGCAVFVVRLIVAFVKARRMIASSDSSVPQEVLTDLDALRDELGIRRAVRLVVHPHITAPVFVGLIRPTILWPTAEHCPMDHSHRQAALVHELAHLRHHDDLIGLAAELWRAVSWCYLPVHWTLARARRAREFLCDDLTAAHFARPEKYAQWLVALVPVRVPGLVVCSSMGGSNGLAGRVRRLLREELRSAVPVSRAQATTIAALSVLLMLCAGSVRLVGFSAHASGGEVSGSPVDAGEAELMGRVEHFFLNNFRDVTARKSIEWGNVQTHEEGNRSIRYKYYATIWDKKILVMNQIFTFDPEGNFVSVDNVEGFPKEKTRKAIDTSTKEGLIELVEDFFQNNFRDVSSRKTIEWGEVVKHEDGNSSIRYKYEATIWGKETKIINQVFTFDPQGEFVSDRDAAGLPVTTRSEVPSTVVLQYAFDGTGPSVRDESGREKHGELHGAERREGTIGTGLFFDGTDDYVVVPDIRLTNFTFSAWVAPASEDVNNRRVLLLDDGEHYYSLEGNVRGGATLFVDRQIEMSDYGYRLPIGEWTHIAATYNGKTARLYVNGELAMTKKGTFSRGIQGTLYLGGIDRHRGGFWHGAIDEVTIFDQALSEKEVKQLMLAASDRPG